MVATSIKVTGAGKVIASLKARTAGLRKKVSVSGGYSAPYAARVHEDLTVHHPNGQAKYLETPLRQYKPEFSRIVAYNVANKESLETACVRAWWFLMNESQKLVPVATGNLRDSAYVRVN
jgi:hypothetical protein